MVLCAAHFKDDEYKHDRSLKRNTVKTEKNAAFNIRPLQTQQREASTAVGRSAGDNMYSYQTALEWHKLLALACFAREVTE